MTMNFEPPFKCLYCLKDKNEVSFTKVEHTIPESLGNQSYVLPVGFVCDDCNNFFSTIENTVLSSPAFKVERTSAGILTKKQRYSKIERPGIKMEFREETGMPHFHFDEVEAGENLRMIWSQE
jgi:HNH endonuclease